MEFSFSKVPVGEDLGWHNPLLFVFLSTQYNTTDVSKDGGDKLNMNSFMVSESIHADYLIDKEKKKQYVNILLEGARQHFNENIR